MKFQNNIRGYIIIFGIAISLDIYGLKYIIDKQQLSINIIVIKNMELLLKPSCKILDLGRADSNWFSPDQKLNKSTNPLSHWGEFARKVVVFI